MSDGYGEDDLLEDDDLPPREPGSRWGAVLIGLITVVAVAVLVWWWFLGGDTGVEESATPTPSATASATAEPSDTQSPTPSTEPSDTPSATASSTTTSPAACESFGTDQDSASSDEWFADLTADVWGADMRVGTHDCYDRWVFEFAGDGDAPGWSVTVHDSNTFVADPSGEDIDPLAGAAALEVRFAAWYDGTPIEQAAYDGETDITTDGFPAIQEARIISGFEGMTQVGIGLDDVRPYRVTWLTDPGRLVIDVYNG